MAKECKPCGSRTMRGKRTPIQPGKRKEWRVFFTKGQTRDYYTEADADAAIEKHGDPAMVNYGCRKQRLSR